MVGSEGVEPVTLREIARRVGVSHAAPAHHFGDRRGLLTALAAEGFELLVREMAAVAEDFRAVAVSYVSYAVDHPGHFAVMYRRDLLNPDDPRLVAARTQSRSILFAGIAQLPTDLVRGDTQDAALAAWSLVHGLASLWLDGALSDSGLVGNADPQELTGRIADMLFG